jgi:site-specific DNA-methyltransferase (adenine-specific)
LSEPPYLLLYQKNSFQTLIDEYNAEYGSEIVDCIITDPPYNEHVQKNLCSGSLIGTKSVPKYELPFAPLASYNWINDAVCLAKRWTVSFCALEDLGLYKQAAPKAYVRGGLFYKANAMGQLTADRPATAYEGIAMLHNPGSKKRWNGKGSYGIWKCNGTRGKKGRHLNEKPINLCLKLVALFSERGETVLDPFCGSAAIGEACLLLGRKYIGWDQDEQWVDKSKQRLENIKSSFGQMKDEDALALCRMNSSAP